MPIPLSLKRKWGYAICKLPLDTKSIRPNLQQTNTKSLTIEEYYFILIFKLTYAGEAPLNLFHLDELGKQLIFKIDGSESRITVEELIPPLLIS